MTPKPVHGWPEGVAKPGATRAFVDAYRKAFDSDASATFCAGEIDGVTVVIAVGIRGQQLQAFVKDAFDGVIERPPVSA